MFGLYSELAKIPKDDQHFFYIFLWIDSHFGYKQKFQK
jgi:hypothetical protein